MPMTQASFDQANNVLFRAKILHSTGWHVSLAEGGYNIGAADVVDLNKNGVADTANRPSQPFRSRVMFTEPALVVPYQTIKNEAATLKQGSIFTQPDLANFMVEDFGVDFGNTAFQRDQLIAQNQRPIGAIVSQMYPIGAGMGCAINTDTDEFMIYQPKPAPAPAAPAKS